MREASLEIAKLCESWRDRLADSSRNEQPRYAEELLGLLGWELPIPFTPQGGIAALSAAPYLLRARGQTLVAAYFLMPGVLDPPSAVLDRGLDFCAATRVLVDETRALNVPFALATDMYRYYLYDTRTEELLLCADDPKSFNGEFADTLRRERMERGSLEEVRRQPRSTVARQLREWAQRWIEHMVSRARISEELACLMIDRLLVIRFLFDHDILRRTKWRLQQRFMDLVSQASEARPDGVGDALTRLFHDMWFDWKLDLFEAVPELDHALSNDAVAAPLLRECSLLARGKFQVDVILESFNYGDPSEKMRVRMVPDENEERDRYLHKQSLETIDEARIEIDLLEEGYRAIFHWFDKVAALYERLDADFDSRIQGGQPPVEGFDLFAWSEVNSQRPNACADSFAHACEQGFGIYHASPRQYRIARLLLTLHLIRRYDQTRRPVDALPSLKNVLMNRPRVLSSDRVMTTRFSSESRSDSYR